MLFETGQDGLLIERLRVTSAGNVGIGTSSPAAKLDVTGNINASGNLAVGGTLSLQAKGSL